MYQIKLLRKTVEKCQSILLDYRYFPMIAIFLLCFEAFMHLNAVYNQPFAHVNWFCYMQQVETVINGTFDYYEIECANGPIVYPGGFVYIFSAIYVICERGQNLLKAQYLFFVFYVLNLYLVYRIYISCKNVPPYALIIHCCMSRNVRQIFYRSLFNDWLPGTLVNLALNLFISGKWWLGSVVYSLAVSTKMNALLYAPALLVAYLVILGTRDTIKQLSICASVQIILGLPFLITNPVAYLHRSFDFGKTFDSVASVNWRFLTNTVLHSRFFHVGLLAVHVLLLVYFYPGMRDSFIQYRYTKLQQLEKFKRFEKYGGLKTVRVETANQNFLYPFFVSHFIGIVFCRSLHFQYYVWYCYTIPFLLWCTNFPNALRLLLMVLLETIWYCWNIDVPSEGFKYRVHVNAGLLVWHFIVLGNLTINLYSHKWRTKINKY